MQKSLNIDPGKCTGCLQCEMACSYEHTGTFNPSRSYIKVFTFHDEGRFAPYTCTQCDEAWCQRACPVDAISVDLYSHYLLEIAAHGHQHIVKFLDLPSRDYSFIALEPRPWKMFKRFSYVFLRRPKFFCINDHLGEPSRSANLLLQIFLRSYFPHPSSFELA